jgi:hypothetical protein
MLSDTGLLEVLRKVGGGCEPSQLIGALKSEIVRHDPNNLCDDDVSILIVRATGREAPYPLRARLKAVGRFLKACGKALNPRAERPPFPDLVLANIGGAIFPALARSWRAAKS